MLHIIARHKAFRILKYMVNKVDIKKYSRPNKDGNTFIHLLIVKVNYAEEVLNVLNIDSILNALDKFNYRNKHGLDLINLSAEKGNVRVLIHLSERGLDLCVKDEKGNSAIANALIKKHVHVVKWLIEKGSDVLNDEYILNLLVSEDEPDYVDLALSI
mmetsp:Transcript_31820/g.26846  ORF Transcript_31820/g.26846 Transcript_31820/m.26846 type:complete len:158 (+) Transcript_31820:73-546(+)